MNLIVLCGALVVTVCCSMAWAVGEGPILTPPAPATPRINGPSVFGVRPRVPFLYTIPATGERPMTFSAERLPAGLTLDAATGQITGLMTLDQGADDSHEVLLRAQNAQGEATKRFRIVVGDRIALTPAMGWNSWNCWAGSVDQEKVLRSAKAMAASGLKDHGWTYINIDDTWQGQRSRGGPLVGNEKFPDMKKLTDDIHALGLKAGIYSTPWITSYAKFPGGSSDSPDGKWTQEMATKEFQRHGNVSFAAVDAKQYAAWGFDYLKYDWNPNDIPHVKEMSAALRGSGRDIVYSLSNTAPFASASDLALLANSWRTTGDIWDRWDAHGEFWNFAVSEIAFSQDRWAPYAGPGHFNDPDMLVVGWVGWGPKLHLTQLTPDEQYTHITMWCMLSAPLLIGCDMERLDPFTLNLLTNDEVLAIDQDALARPATRVATVGVVDVFMKELEDGSRAVAFCNRGPTEAGYLYNKFRALGVSGPQKVRDLWRQKDLDDVDGQIPITVPSHGVLLLKFTPKK